MLKVPNLSYDKIKLRREGFKPIISNFMRQTCFYYRREVIYNVGNNKNDLFIVYNTPSPVFARIPLKSEQSYLESVH